MLSSVPEPADDRRQRGAPFGQLTGHGIEIAAMHVAPAPGLAALEGGDDRVTGRIEMVKRVRMLRILAASDMTTRETDTELIPHSSERDALLAAVRPRLDGLNLTEMFTTFGHVSYLANSSGSALRLPKKISTCPGQGIQSEGRAMRCQRSPPL